MPVLRLQLKVICINESVQIEMKVGRCSQATSLFISVMFRTLPYNALSDFIYIRWCTTYIHVCTVQTHTQTHIRKWAHIPISFPRSFFPFDIYCHSNRSTFTRHQSYVVHLKFDLQTNMLENMLSIIFVSALWWLLLLLVLLLLFFFCVKKVFSTSNTMCQIDAIWIMRRNAIMVIQPSFFVCACMSALFIYRATSLQWAYGSNVMSNIWTN